MMGFFRPVLTLAEVHMHIVAPEGKEHRGMERIQQLLDLMGDD